MKFNWGTGIFLFLILFLAGAAVFIVFATKQQVNLVHKDYYEEGVDYSEQMRVDARSRAYLNAISTQSTEKSFVINFDRGLASRIDSGMIHMYRPSDSTKDIKAKLKADDMGSLGKSYQFDKKDLLNGRYILKFTWYSQGLEYQVNKPVSVQ